MQFPSLQNLLYLVMCLAKNGTPKASLANLVVHLYVVDCLLQFVLWLLFQDVYFCHLMVGFLAFCNKLSSLMRGSSRSLEFLICCFVRIAPRWFLFNPFLSSHNTILRYCCICNRGLPCFSISSWCVLIF
ncbi:hypothetical protein NC652_027889 [Populus alba x Populus x berolinensis]|nr:hypothetical protein NC652_027889 [Populus alba x Populus x berolinensis]